jgi:hypothetical protein
MMIWQLLQVRHVRETPLILVGKMWSELVDWAAAHLLKPELALASAEDTTIPVCVNTADEAVALIAKHHAEWLQETTK